MFAPNISGYSSSAANQVPKPLQEFSNVLHGRNANRKTLDCGPYEVTLRFACGVTMRVFAKDSSVPTANPDRKFSSFIG